MAKRTIRDYRRNELIDATIASIAAHGLSDTTLATIAEEAGVSPALVNHYFDGKEELLEATLRRLTKDLAQEIKLLTPTNPTPLERLDAIIDGCLQPEQLRPGAMLAWRAFWSYLPVYPRLAALQRTVNRRFRSNIRCALREVIPKGMVEETYLGLYALIDGFWIRHLIDPGSFSMVDARRICRTYLQWSVRATMSGATLGGAQQSSMYES